MVWPPSVSDITRWETVVRSGRKGLGIGDELTAVPLVERHDPDILDTVQQSGQPFVVLFRAACRLIIRIIFRSNCTLVNPSAFV